MLQTDIDKLVEKYLSRTITAREKEILLQWYQERSEENIEWLANTAYEEDIVKQRMYTNIMAHVDEQQKPAARIQSLWYMSAAAVIIAVVISVTLFLFNNTFEQLPISKVKNERYKNDIPSGSNKALLTLGDGSKIILDEAANGVIGKQGNAVISKTDKGQLAYNSKVGTAALQINIISTPKGGQYHVLLSDGTRVWLNAASTLKFPAAFTGNKREVQLTGEAYFEVAKHEKMPFTVSVNKMQVQVLGTHFNIAGYDDDNTTTTTLLEGSVRIYNGSDNSLLKPGQQATLNKTSQRLLVADTDIEEAVAWKNGYFMFVNEDVKSIMQKLSRWYNIDVDYKGDTPHKALWGTVSKYKNISEVLDMLELTGVVKFKIEGRRVTVMP